VGQIYLGEVGQFSIGANSWDWLFVREYRRRPCAAGKDWPILRRDALERRW